MTSSSSPQDLKSGGDLAELLTAFSNLSSNMHPCSSSSSVPFRREKAVGGLNYQTHEIDDYSLFIYSRVDSRGSVTDPDRTESEWGVGLIS